MSLAKRKEIQEALEALEKFKYPGPYGCRCQTLAHKLVGDGCSECNPAIANELSRINDGPKGVKT